MNGAYFQLAQEFIEQCTRAHVHDVARLFRASVEKLGFRYFACCSHVDPLRPPHGAVVLHSYPVQWAQTFSEERLVRTDPVLRRADHSLLPFFWDARDFRAQLSREEKAILWEAGRFGIAHGYTIPIHAPSVRTAFRASCSVVPDAPSLHMEAYLAVELMARHLYDAASRASNAAQSNANGHRLTLRERQCLELVARGKSDWVVSKLLGISERTVHNHIERAKRRLGVATRVQAIVHALATRQISFGDVLHTDTDGRQNAHGVRSD